MKKRTKIALTAAVLLLVCGIGLCTAAFAVGAGSGRLYEEMQDRLGHKDIRITLNTYGHLYPNQQRKIANLLDNENGNAVTGLGEERDEC